MRLKARRGPKKAVVAVAASILTAAYHMLADGTCYQDLGAAYFTRRDLVVAKLASRIRSLGYDVAVKVAEFAGEFLERTARQQLHATLTATS